MAGGEAESSRGSEGSFTIRTRHPANAESRVAFLARRYGKRLLLPHRAGVTESDFI